MAKTMHINGTRFTVLSVTDRMGHNGDEVVAVYRLRSGPGVEYVLREGWSRPPMGKHKRLWRELERT